MFRYVNYVHSVNFDSDPALDQIKERLALPFTLADDPSSLYKSPVFENFPRFVRPFEKKHVRPFVDEVNSVRGSTGGLLYNADTGDIYNKRKSRGAKPIGRTLEWLARDPEAEGFQKIFGPYYTGIDYDSGYDPSGVTDFYRLTDDEDAD